MVMSHFYYDLWLPFIDSKRPIIILAIATYMALC